MIKKLGLNLLAVAAVCSPFLVAGCGSVQSDITAATTAVQAACTDALTAGNVAAASTKGGAANTVASINQYVVAGCQTAQAVAALAANSSSVAWLEQQTGALQAVAATPAK